MTEKKTEVVKACNKTPDIELLAAAQKGDAKAQFELAEWYDSNAGLEVALPWFKKAADQGLASAQWVMGKIYSEGQHPDCFAKAPDYISAEQWFRLATEQGDIEAMHELICIYENRELDGLVVEHVNRHGEVEERVLDLYNPKKGGYWRKRSEGEAS